MVCQWYRMPIVGWSLDFSILPNQWLLGLEKYWLLLGEVGTTELSLVEGGGVPKTQFQLSPRVASSPSLAQILAPRLLQLVDKNFPELGCPDLKAQKDHVVKCGKIVPLIGATCKNLGPIWWKTYCYVLVEFRIGLFHVSLSCFYPSSALRFLDELLFLRANRLSSLAAERLLNLSRCNGRMWGKRLAALHVTFTCHWLTLDVFVNLLAASLLPYTSL